MPPKLDKSKQSTPVLRSQDSSGISEPLLQKDELDAIINRAIAAANKSLIDDLTQKFDARFDKVRSDYIKLQDENAALSTTVDRLNDELISVKDESAQQKSLIKDQSDTISVLSKRLDECMLMANRNEQHSRKNSLKFTGLAIKQGQSAELAVASMMREKLGMDIQQGDIEIAHTVKRRKPPANGKVLPDPIHVKFSKRGPRNEAIKRRTQLKGTGCGIQEDLTLLNLQLVNRLKNHDELDEAWSWNCRVYARTKQDKIKILFEPFDDVTLKITEARAAAAASANAQNSG